MEANVDQIKDEALKPIIGKIMAGLNRSVENIPEDEPDANRFYLGELIGFLNNLDREDFFGTEGWEHDFGIRD